MTPEEFRKICDAADGYIDLGLYEDATNLLEDLPSAAKISKEVIALKMAILIKTGQPLKASYLAENLSFGEPDNVALMLEVACLRYEAGEFTEALKWLDAFESKCVGRPAFHFIRAKCHAAVGNTEACILSLRTAHEIDPALKWATLEDPAFEAIFGQDPNN